MGGWAGTEGAFSVRTPARSIGQRHMLRWAAKHVVASGMAEKCEIQLAYAIGVSDPVSVFVNTMGSGTIADQEQPRGQRGVRL